MLLRSASIRTSTFSPRGRAFAVMGLPARLLVDEIDESGFILVFELVRLEMACLLIDDVPGEIEHVLGDFDILNVVETHLVGIAQPRTIKSLRVR
jgi:hypothetical protein